MASSSTTAAGGAAATTPAVACLDDDDAHPQKQSLLGLMTPTLRALYNEIAPVAAAPFVEGTNNKKVIAHPLFERVPDRTIPSTTASSPSPPSMNTKKRRHSRQDEEPQTPTHTHTNPPASSDQLLPTILHTDGLLTTTLPFLGTKSCLAGLGALTPTTRPLVKQTLSCLHIWHVRRVEPCFASFPLLRRLTIINLDLVRDPTYLHRGLVSISQQLQSLSLSETMSQNHNLDLPSWLLSFQWPKLVHLDVPADADFLEYCVREDPERGSGGGGGGGEGEGEEEHLMALKPSMFPSLVSLDVGDWRSGINYNVGYLCLLLRRGCFPSLARIEQRRRGGEMVPVEFRCLPVWEGATEGSRDDLMSFPCVFKLLDRLRGIEKIHLTMALPGGARFHENAIEAWERLLTDERGLGNLRHLTLSASSRSFNRPFLEALGSPHAKLPHLQELVLNMGPADTVVNLPHLQMAKGSLSSLHSLTIKSDLPWSFLGTLLQDACVSEDGTNSKLMHLSVMGGNSRQRTIDALWGLLAKANTFSPPWLQTLKSLTVQGHTDYRFWEFCGYTIGHANEVIAREMRAGLARLPALESLNVQLNFLEAFLISFMSLRDEGALANLKILRTSILPLSPSHGYPQPPAHTPISTAAQFLFLRWLKQEREGLARDLKALDFPIFEKLPPALARAICDVYPAHDTIEM